MRKRHADKIKTIARVRCCKTQTKRAPRNTVHATQKPRVKERQLHTVHTGKITIITIIITIITHWHRLHDLLQFTCMYDLLASHSPLAAQKGQFLGSLSTHFRPVSASTSRPILGNSAAALAKPKQETSRNRNRNGNGNENADDPCFCWLKKRRFGRRLPPVLVLTGNVGGDSKVAGGIMVSSCCRWCSWRPASLASVVSVSKCSSCSFGVVCCCVSIIQRNVKSLFNRGSMQPPINELVVVLLHTVIIMTSAVMVTVIVIAIVIEREKIKMVDASVEIERLHSWWVWALTIN